MRETQTTNPTFLSNSSIVSFGPKQRFLGEAAKTQEISNFKNTVVSLKRLAGRTFDDPEVQEIEKDFIMAELADVNGQAGVKVCIYESKSS
jgi:heat shock protein 4